MEKDRQLFRNAMFANKSTLLDNIHTTIENGTSEGTTTATIAE